MHSTFSLTPRLLLMLVIVTVAAVGACSTFQPPDPNGPRSNVQPYPVLLQDGALREQDSVLAWQRLAQNYGVGNRKDVQIHPSTATIKGLPAGLNPPIVLPKVGTNPTQTEEEIRESLRRFISEWQPLIGADPAQLSLVERVDEPSGIKLARYEQRPFRYPLRGGFGELVIRFTGDRRVVEVSSSCLPSTDRLQAELSQLIPKVSWEEAGNSLKGQTITYGAPGAGQQTFTITSNDVTTVRQLVIYVIQPSPANSPLELHLAWEIELPNRPVKTVYLDAIEARVLATS